jgi:hypothetical protein
VAEAFNNPDIAGRELQRASFLSDEHLNLF